MIRPTFVSTFVRRVALTALVVLCGLPSIANAGLVIYVEEDTGPNTVTFSWNGIVGASGTPADTNTQVGSADFINPNGTNTTSRFSVADYDRTDVDAGIAGGGWTYYAAYAGSTNIYGSGGNYTTFTVDANTSFYIHPGTGELRVGAVTDEGTDDPDLSTHVFTGSFTLNGTFATYGLFDTPTTQSPVTLWQAASGDGFIQLVAVPEPASAAMLGLALVPLMRRRRRA